MTTKKTAKPRAPLSVDIAGQTFNRLTVVSRADNSANGSAMWLCKCECGNTKVVLGSNLRLGHTRSCGCLAKESKSMLSHGMFGTREYSSWNQMMTRCYNEKDSGYFRYGGRGIKVDPSWHRFEGFFASIGRRPPNTSIDRIDNDGDYTPSNCRWADNEQQANNTRQNVILVAFGERKSVAQWARDPRCKATETALRLRIRAGMGHESAITTASKPRKKATK